MKCHKEEVYTLCSRCSLGGQEVEINGYLLLHCNTIVNLWNLFLCILGVSWVVPKNTFEILNWKGVGSRGAEENWWKIIPACTWWTIWKERNARCFEGKSSKIQKVKMNCLSFLNISVNKIWWGSRSFSRLYRKNVKFRDVIDDALCSLRVVSSHLHIFVSKFDVSVLFSIMTSY